MKWTLGDRIPGTQYVIVKLLGSGGQGDVYEARHVILDTPVVVKVLRADQTGPSVLVRFHDEARVQAKLDHPNIAPVLDAGATDEATPQHFFVMKKLDGVTVHALMRRRPYGIPVRSAIQIALDVLAALEAAHALGIIHRDIKPANIFLTRVSPIITRAVVMDFGIAKLTMEIRPKTGGVAATFEWAAPEQFLEKPCLQSDLYNVGLLLFFLISGQHVFGQLHNRGEYVDAHLHKPPRRLGDVVAIDPALDAFVHQLLEKEPARRTPSARNARERLTKILDRLEVENEKHLHIPEAKTDEMALETLMTKMGEPSDLNGLVADLEDVKLLSADRSTDKDQAAHAGPGNGVRSVDPTPVVRSRPEGTTPDPALGGALVATVEERRGPIVPGRSVIISEPAAPEPPPPPTDIHPPVPRRPKYEAPPPRAQKSAARDASFAPSVRSLESERASRRVRGAAIGLASAAFAIAIMAIVIRVRGSAAPAGSPSASPIASSRPLVAQTAESASAAPQFAATASDVVSAPLATLPPQPIATQSSTRAIVATTPTTVTTKPLSLGVAPEHHALPTVLAAPTAPTPALSNRRPTSGL